MTVNGAPVGAGDETTVVDVRSDVLTVRGRRLVFGAGNEDEDVEAKRGTRMQRDFTSGKFGEKAGGAKEKNFSRGVDGGFLAKKRWIGGK